MQSLQRPKPQKGQTRREGRSGSSCTGGVIGANAVSAKVAAALAPADEVAYESLKAWRLEAAREADVPALVILHDSVLREIAAARPKNKAALAAISGIGESKLLRFGKGILGLSPPSREDLPVREVSAKSADCKPVAFLQKPRLLWANPLNWPIIDFELFTCSCPIE